MSIWPGWKRSQGLVSHPALNGILWKSSAKNESLGIWHDVRARASTHKLPAPRGWFLLIGLHNVGPWRLLRDAKLVAQALPQNRKEP